MGILIPRRMTTGFVHEQPPRIFFGPGQRREIPDLLGASGNRVLLLTGNAWFDSSPFRPEIVSLLSDHDLTHLRCPSGEPAAERFSNLLGQAREARPDWIVAIGGGSVLDTAKALSGLIPRKEKIEDFLEGVSDKPSVITAPGVPWIAVPTTSGTGAEVTKNAVINSRALGVKRSLRSPYLLSACAVVDPELTLSLPLSTTGTAGMDALTQLIESFVSKKAQPIPRSLIRGAFPGMLGALSRLAGEPNDLGARTDAAYGSLVSGLALANSGLGAAHGFASGLGGLADVPHGLICAVFIRPVLKANADFIREEIATLMQGLPGNGEEDPVERLIGEISGISRSFGLPDRFTSHTIDPHSVEEIARRSSGSSMSGNPRELSVEERIRIIESVV